MNYKISVIIPVYNVEKYIEKCLHTLFQQTLSEIEYIFVNDCSNDRSMEVLFKVIELYPLRKPHVKIINHKINKGVAAARTSAMKVMTGEYMAHCDADDWIDSDAYERMYVIAKLEDADMVTCKYYNEPNHADVKGTAFSGSAMNNLRKGQYTYGLWDKIIRSSIIKDNSIYPFEGINYNEDLNVIVRTLCYSKKVIGMEAPFYHHLMDREGSICTNNYVHSVFTHSVPCMKRLDKWLDEFGKNHKRPEITSKLTNPLKFWMKVGFYVNGDIKTWRNLWPECRLHVFKVKSMSLKEKILMFFRSYKSLFIN